MTDFSNLDLDATINQFEAAASAQRMEVPGLTVRRMLLALDGSNQDRAVLELGRAVATRLGCAVLVTYAYEQSTPDSEKDRYLAEHAMALGRAGRIEAAHARAPGGGRAFRQILDLSKAHGCDLSMFPSPYLEDFQDVGGSSVGTTTDVLVHRRSNPLLVVRKPAENVRDRLERVVLPLNLLSERGAEAAAWALGLTPSDGTIHLLAVVDEEMLDAVRHLVGQSFRAAEVDEASLAGLGRPDVAGLVAVIQRRASEANVDCRVTVRHGPLIQTVAAFANGEPGLLVVGCGDDCAASDYQRTLGLLRESRNPVLMV
ncbi:universal stress protein [Azospirillum sp. YIM DDC1]|uniref:Universal stress protein n=1 Tax=Azospirillum aestuarii TaxID=2802052 RepID=A0ABS1I8D5_9PROT|nr:universal stress protein [Azospirillum aestuarii]MBK4723298.1 universal stress protein [Azospirillum aestuarii]